MPLTLHIEKLITGSAVIREIVIGLFDWFTAPFDLPKVFS
jgi:hypothetical protein